MKKERIKQYMSLDIPHSFKHAQVLAILDKLGYFTAPASIGHHGNTEGGLFDHSLNVAHELERLTEKLDLAWDSEQSPIIIGLFHDLCKCDDYIFVGDKWEHNPNKTMPGHGDKSLIMFGNIPYLILTDEEVSCIRWHMGAFDSKENWKYYTQAVKNYPNVLWTHTADMYASQIKEKKDEI